MENILITGSTGQIGSELTMTLRAKYGNSNVIAGFIKGNEPHGKLLESGPSAEADVTNPAQIAGIVKHYKINIIYNMAALLSAVAEAKPQLAWKTGVEGLFNILEIAREMHCAVFTPSSIGAFGPGTPKDRTPQDTIQRPQTMYGVTKVTGELLSDYYYRRFGVDTRSVRYPGLISYMTPPGGGTTDYAVQMYHSAVKGEVFKSPISAGTFMDMMYMPDALCAAVKLMEADPARLVHRNSFNVTAMSFDPETLKAAILKHIPGFKMIYEPDAVRQAIADSWPNSIDDSCAREEWGWSPGYDIDSMTVNMLEKLNGKYN
jgi:nucleoside-diphosphate-sugar epimerase